MKMKNVMIVTAALVTALVLGELVACSVIGYPVISRRERRRFIPSISKNRLLILYEPYSKFWAVEGGNHVYRRNNLGLPGNDVDLDADKQTIMVAGSSFIEAYHIPQDEIATAVFHKLLEDSDPGKYRVINAAAAKHDPYLAWYRTMFLARIYQPDKVILPVESLFNEWLVPYKTPLDFTIPQNFGEPATPGLIVKIEEAVRQKSHLANLMTRALHTILRRKSESNAPKEIARIPGFPEAMKESILQFHKSFGDDFLLVSFDNDARENKMLEDFCEENGIHFYSDESVLQPKNCFNGAGHLNVEGNKKLGELLEKAFSKTYPNRQKKA